MKTKRSCLIGRSFLVRATLMFPVLVCLISSQAVSQEKPIELRFTTSASPLHPTFKASQEYADELKRRTGGKVLLTVYPIGTLCPPFETYKAVKTGIAEIGSAPVGFSGPVLPLNKLFGDALRGLPTSTEAVRAYRTALGNVPELRAEFEGVHPLYFWSTWAMGISTSKRQITKMEDLKGVVMRFPPGLEVLAKAWGASPISIPVNDLYVALQKGTIDGYFASPEVLKAWRLAEQTKYTALVEMVYGLAYVAMNQKTWESLPPDIRKTIDGLSEWATNLTCEYMDKAEKENLKFAEAQGVKFVEIEKGRLQEFYGASEPVFDKIAGSLEAKGKAGLKVLKEARRLSKN